jgi:hypothetical protein
MEACGKGSLPREDCTVYPDLTNPEASCLGVVLEEVCVPVVRPASADLHVRGCCRLEDAILGWTDGTVL